MLKVLAEQWCKNQNKLKKYLKDNYETLNSLMYKDIVKIAFEQVYQDELDALDYQHITEIDNGNYQGTLLFLIPFNTYQPNEYQYLMTYIDYGSCSGCDTLLSLQSDFGYYGDNDKTKEDYLNEKINGFMCLCKDILMNAIKPYNSGWRKEEKWEQVEWDGSF